MSDLVTVKNGELIVADDVISELQDFYVEKTKMELKEKRVKKSHPDCYGAKQYFVVS